MRTSYSDLIRTEKYLDGQLDPQDTVLFEARLLVEERLRMNTFYHRMVRKIVLQYQREKMRADLLAIHNRLMQNPAKRSFRDEIRKIFKS